MTISSEIRTAGPFTGNGVTFSFPFVFKIFNADELIVVQTDTDGVDTTLAYGAQFSVTLNSDQNNSPGGTITYKVASVTTPLPTGYVLNVTSDVANLQEQSIKNGSGFFPNVIEDGLDRVTILTQQLVRAVNNSIKFPLSDGTDLIATLDNAIVRANKLLGFDADGNVRVVSQEGDLSVVTATGSTTGRALSDRFSDFVYIPDYGAVGDGVTDDTVAITAAVAAANTRGAVVVWTNNHTYVTTASIPFFHDVRHIGRAIVKRGTALWHILPISSNEEQHLYYDLTSGDNLNDGLSSSFPRKTLPQLRTDILWFNTNSMLVAGYWTFHVIGSATNAALDFGSVGVNTSYPVVIDFSSVTVTHNGSSTATNAIATSGGSFEIHGTLTINGGGVLANGIYGRRGELRIYSTATVTINDCDVGFYADDGCYYNQDSTTSTTNNCTEGMVVNNSNGTDYSTHNSCSFGTTCTRNSTMHVRTVVNDATMAALIINHGARVDLEDPGNNWKRCAVGVVTYDSATLSISSGTDLSAICNMGTADACTIMAQHFGSSNNGAFTGNVAFPYQLIGLRNDTLTVTGTTSATLLGAVYGTTTTGIKQIPAYLFGDKGKTLVVRAWGNVTGTAGLHTLSLRTSNADGSNVQTLVSRTISTSAGEFDIEFVVFATATNAQKYCTRAVFGGATVVLNNGTNTINFNVIKHLRLFGQLANAADQIVMEGIHVYFSG